MEIFLITMGGLFLSTIFLWFLILVITVNMVESIKESRRIQLREQKQIIDAIYDDYKNNIESVLMRDYVGEIKELN